jgi:glutamine synthetase
LFSFSKGYAFGVEFLVGFETEFILLKSTNPIEAVNDAPWSASCALPSGSDEAKCLEEIADALQTGEIDLLMYHSEGAPGQVREFPVIIGVADMDRGWAV